MGGVLQRNCLNPSHPAVNQFDPKCCRCERLVRYLTETKTQYPEYHCGPVAAFGDPKARLLIVGLAPGKHGANATARPFTGDYAGILLYETLYRFGLSNKPVSVSRGDSLRLRGCRITNAVKCLPPDNKPTTEEVRRCNTFLAAEIKDLPFNSVALALGTVAHNAVLRALGLTLNRYKFGHGRTHRLEQELWLVDSYHCSRYNTQTKRLTKSGFHAVFDCVSTLLEAQA